MHFRKRDKAFLIAVLSITVASWFLLGEKALSLVLIGIVLATIAVQIEIYRNTIESIKRMTNGFEESTRAQRQAYDQTYRQVESLISLSNLLKFNAPLPPMRDWAISPDFASLIVTAINERAPERVLELGSGVSTVLAAYALKAIGKGRIVSLDHDDRFARMTRDCLRSHGLTEFAEVICSPLREIVIGNRSYRWYGRDCLTGLGSNDLLIVDGPPGNLQEMARYPALPVLWDHLSDDALVLMDDAARTDERKILELWLREFPELTVELPKTEEGAALLRRNKHNLVIRREKDAHTPNGGERSTAAAL